LFVSISVTTTLILNFTLELHKRHGSSATGRFRVGDGKHGRVGTFIRQLEVQIIEDFGEPGCLSISEQDLEEIEDMDQNIPEVSGYKTLFYIDAEEYPWVVNSTPDVEHVQVLNHANLT